LGRRFDQLKERVGGSAGTTLAPSRDVSTRTDRAAKGKSHIKAGAASTTARRSGTPDRLIEKYISYQAGALGVPMRHLLGVEPNCHKEIPIGASTPKLQRRSF
jgi:hypothetical protein